jgi:hypothetical protein
LRGLLGLLLFELRCDLLFPTPDLRRLLLEFSRS